MTELELLLSAGARPAETRTHKIADRPIRQGLTCKYAERVTGIEPALSAWESDRSGPLTGLTWGSGAPLVTVIDPGTPGLMACQWPEA